MAARPSRRLVAVTARPAVAPGALTLAVFEAALQRYGLAAIDDVLPGPRSSVVLVISILDAPRTGAHEAPLGTAVAHVLRRRGLADIDVEVHAVPLESASTFAEVVDMWIAELREMSGHVATRHAYSRAIEALLDEHAIRTLFQPIIDIGDGRVLGYEALSRGPHDHPLESVQDLLDAAQVAGRSAEVQAEMAWLAATRATAALPHRGALLFLNAGSDLSWWRRFAPASSRKRWPRGQIVVEFSEHSHIEPGDEVVRHREEARPHGLRFALDDTGAGYAGLSTLALLAPEFVKVDISLVRGCDRTPFKREIIASLLTLGRTGEFTVIAEGIETAAELAALRSLGVRFGQGFLLGLPEEVPSAEVPGIAWQADAVQRGA